MLSARNDFAFLVENQSDKVYMSNLELIGSLTYTVNASANEEDEQVLEDWGFQPILKTRQ